MIGVGDLDSDVDEGTAFVRGKDRVLVRLLLAARRARSGGRRLVEDGQELLPSSQLGSIELPVGQGLRVDVLQVLGDQRAALFDALLGLRVTRPSYVKLTELDERTATRDLVHATELGLLDARGERRGRHYVAGEPLRKFQEQLRAERKPLQDPYPTLLGEIRRALP